MVGTNNPPLGAYPANRASSKVYSSSPPRVDLYFIISLLFDIIMVVGSIYSRRGQERAERSFAVVFDDFTNEAHEL